MAPECAWFAGSHVEGVVFSVAKKGTHHQEAEAMNTREWWIPNLSRGLQSAIEVAVAAIGQILEEHDPEENSEEWASLASADSYAEAVEEQWADHQAEMAIAGVPSLQDPDECMDLDQDQVQVIQIAVKTCCVGEPTVLVDTHLGEMLIDFMTKTHRQLQIKPDQALRVSFGCKTL